MVMAPVKIWSCSTQELSFIMKRRNTTILPSTLDRTSSSDHGWQHYVHEIIPSLEAITTRGAESYHLCGSIHWDWIDPRLIKTDYYGIHHSYHIRSKQWSPSAGITDDWVKTKSIQMHNRYYLEKTQREKLVPSPSLLQSSMASQQRDSESQLNFSTISFYPVPFKGLWGTP